MTDTARPRRAPDHAPRRRPRSRRRRRRTREAGTTPRWIYAVLAVGLFLVVIPFVWMLVSSFKPEAEVRRGAADLDRPRR